MTKEEKLKTIVADPLLWTKYFCKIVDKNGKKIDFEPTYHQKLLARNFGKFNIVAKSRQLGITSWALLYSLYLTHTEPDTTCMIMSYSLDTVDIVFKKLKALYDDLDPSVKLKSIANNRKEILLENRSRVICCVCGSKDQARGATLRYVHLTEVAFMDDKKLQNQLVAIESALRPDGQMVLESTSNGLNMWFELWTKSVNKENQYKPFFFSWLSDKKLFVKEYNEYTKTYKDREGHYLSVEELDEEELELFKKMDGTNNPLAIKKLMWRRIKISNIGLEKFRQEYPSTALESFVTSGNNMFDLQKIQERLIYIHEVQKLNPPTQFNKWKRSINLYDYPRANTKYYCGVDTGEGITNDYSVIEVVDPNGKQVFEFASNKIKPYEFADLVRAVGLYYNTAFLVVEKASGGHTVVDKLADSQNRYINLYKYKSYDAKGNTRKKVGFETNSKSRPIILGRFQEMFDTGQILINSKELLSEMKAFQKDADGKVQAVVGCHDDRIMAFAMALEGLTKGIWYV